MLLKPIAITMLVAALCCSCDSASAKQRRAFVVGIDQYVNLPERAQLKKAVGDAKAVRATLAGLGFEVTVATNAEATRSGFYKGWTDFIAKIQDGDEVAFVFSGHGVEINGNNYLLPSDIPRIPSWREELLKHESIPLREILIDLGEKRPAFTLIIIDACRENPLEREGGRGASTRDGLAPVNADKAAKGTFIMYSAGAHEIALDRLPGNDMSDTSVYMRLLLPQLKQRGVSLLDMADLVGQAVRDLAATVGHEQNPAFYVGVSGARLICLAGCATAPMPDTSRNDAISTPPAVTAVVPPAVPKPPTFSGEWLVTTRWTKKCTNPGRSMKIAVDSAGRIVDLFRLGEKGRIIESVKENIRGGKVSENGRIALRYAVVPRAGALQHINILEGSLVEGSGRARSERNGRVMGCPGFFSVSAITS